MPMAVPNSVRVTASCIVAPRVAAPTTAPTCRAVLYTPEADPTRSCGTSRREIVEFGAQHMALATPNSTTGMSRVSAPASLIMNTANNDIAVIIEANPIFEIIPGATRSVSRPITGDMSTDNTPIGTSMRPAVSGAMFCAVCR